ncbi:MAG: TolC family protein [Deferrisomatales bacterium]|nr:TolC family protein [Deferrisomatales bacterium]
MAEEQGAALTLQQALSQAVRHNPELEFYSLEIRGREAEAHQAGLRPNPLLSLEAENVFGSGPFSRTDAAESTLSISQKVELGKKRDLRRHLAEAETGVAQSDFDVVKADLLARTSNAFFAVLAAQERLRLSEELLDLATRVFGAAEERVAAGRGAQTETIRPRILVREQQIALEKAHRELAAARAALAALMGREEADFGFAAGDLSDLFSPPEQAELDRLLTESPQMVRRVAESERRRRAIRMEEARPIPDLDIGVGARYLRESDDTALILGVSIPLPLFDRNQGTIAAARSRAAQARAEERSALLQAKAALAAAHQKMSAARAEAGALRDDILPASKLALESAEYGYRAGKFGLLDVLDAQRTLVAVQEQYLEALRAFHRAASEMERLLGTSVAPTATAIDFPQPSRSDNP